MREKKTGKEEDKIKWGRLISFLVAIVLLGVAIVISMVQEKTVGEVNYNTIRGSEDSILTEQASSEFSKTVNQVKEQNEAEQIGKNNEQNQISQNNEQTGINSSNIQQNVIGENLANNSQISSNKTGQNNNQGKINKENDDEDDIDNNDTDNEDDNDDDDDTVETNSNNVENTSEFIFPVEGEVIKEFAKDSLIYSETLEEWITHSGIDIKADKATVVKSVAEGTVKSIKNDPRYGLTVTIEHSNGYVSSYSSLLTAEFVKEGEKVEQGQTIGTVGNSAVFEVSEDNHLHFELIKDGSNINPEIYLK